MNRKSVGFLSLTVITVCASAAAQQLPDRCVQMPQRTQVCPNLLYKKSPVDVDMTNTKSGEIVCICMADFEEIRIEATGTIEKTEQQVAISRAASRIGLSENDLLTLIRK